MIHGQYGMQSHKPDEMHDTIKVQFKCMVDYSEQHIISTRRLDGIALWLLLLGGLLFVIPWVIGVFMLWQSPSFTTGNKLLGTLMLPGGLLAAGVFILQEITFTCHSTGNVCEAPLLAHGAINLPILAILIVVPVVVVGYLSTVSRRFIDGQLSSLPNH